MDKAKILNELSAITDMTCRMKYIIDLAKAADGLEESERIPKNRIRGCNSKLWLVPKFEDGLVYFRVDGDAMIPKGIGTILALVYSGMTPDEVMSTAPTILAAYGVTHHLTASRRNGLSGLYKMMRYFSSAYKRL